MAAVFYPGQTDYVEKLNALADLVGGMASGTAGPKLITRQIVTAPGMTRICPPRRCTRSQTCAPSSVCGRFSLAGQSGQGPAQAAQ